MKKIFVTSFFLFLTLALSGCSLGTDTSQNQDQSFQISQSLWKSNDGGVEWQVKDKGQGGVNTKDINAISLAVNPYDGNNVFVGLLSGGILETVDGGDTWKFINFQSEKVYGLVLDPSNGKTLYASGVWQGRGKMFKTENDGQDWKEIYTAPAVGPYVISLTIDKRNPQVIYASTSDNEVIKSSDGGASWKNIAKAQAQVYKISIDSADSNLVYFVTSSGSISRSRDAGGAFEEITGKVEGTTEGFYGGRSFDVLETDPTNPNWVYLAGQSGIIVSKDAGENWEAIKPLNDAQKFPIRTLAINPVNSNEIIYGSSQATYRSVDGGQNWTTFQFNVKKTVNVMAYNPVEASVVYLGFSK